MQWRPAQPAREPTKTAVPVCCGVALFLVQRRCTGAEEGGIWTDQGTLVTDRGLYGQLGAAPAAFLDGAEATAYAERMSEALPALNEGRRPLDSILSDGVYDVLIVEADLLPLVYPEAADAYE